MNPAPDHSGHNPERNFAGSGGKFKGFPMKKCPTRASVFPRFIPHPAFISEEKNGRGVISNDPCLFPDLQPAS